MTKVAITKSLIDDLAASISAKTGETLPLTIAEMTDAVDDMPTPIDTSDANATASDIRSGKSGYVNGSKVSGSLTSRDSTSLSANGDTVTVPAGIYDAQATKSVTSGSATAPATISGTSATVSTGTNTLTLTKSVSVTPSVTAGYVSSGTAGNSSVSLTASVTTKAAASYTPSAQTQTIAANQYLTGAQTINPIPSQYIIPSGNKEITANGTNIDVANYSTVSVNVSGGGGKNVQYVMDKKSVRTNGYTSTGMSITVAKAGTYNVSWVGWRSSSQGSMGTNLYKNGNAGTNQTTFTNTYGQCITLNNQSYAQGDVLTLYATAGSTTRYMWVANLIIEEQ